MTAAKQMKLGAFLPPPGHHIAAWRHPHAVPDGGINLAYYVELAKTAERGKFDLMFLSDGAGVRHTYNEAEDLSRCYKCFGCFKITDVQKSFVIFLLLFCYAQNTIKHLLCKRLN